MQRVKVKMNTLLRVELLVLPTVDTLVPQGDNDVVVHVEPAVSSIETVLEKEEEK
jgi:hypothetical protein